MPLTVTESGTVGQSIVNAAAARGALPLIYATGC